MYFGYMQRAGIWLERLDDLESPEYRNEQQNIALAKALATWTAGVEHEQSE